MRFGKAEEIANLVFFLAQPETDFITGQVISSNGGLVI
jgi:3-oxoacyl-[acyl-carrier protein] reductase